MATRDEETRMSQSPDSSEARLPPSKTPASLTRIHDEKRSIIDQLTQVLEDKFGLTADEARRKIVAIQQSVSKTGPTD